MTLHHFTRRRSVLGASALAVSAAAVAITAVSTAGASEPPFRLVAHQAASSPVDVGAKGDSPGDEFVDAYTLSKPNGRHAGSLTQVCTLVDAAHGLAQCSGTLSLSGARLTFAGPTDSARVTTMAVTGGTGTMHGATGTVVFTPRRSAIDIELRLEDAR